MKLEIRQYDSSDKDMVLSLFSDGILEHIAPCFFNAISSPLYLSITLGLCAAGYILGSILGALVFGASWVGLIYYCCHELYAGFVREKLRTDMQDIPANYLAPPDNCFWVAEAKFSGTSKVVGIVAVVAKQNGFQRYAELFRMIISPSCRRAGLGSRLTQTVFDFCKERSFSKVVLETSSTQTAAVAMYKKIGFIHVFSNTNTHVSEWMTKLARVTILKMEKNI